MGGRGRRPAASCRRCVTATRRLGRTGGYQERGVREAAMGLWPTRPSRCHWYTIHVPLSLVSLRRSCYPSSLGYREGSTWGERAYPPIKGSRIPAYCLLPAISTPPSFLTPTRPNRLPTLLSSPGRLPTLVYHPLPGRCNPFLEHLVPPARPTPSIIPTGPPPTSASISIHQYRHLCIEDTPFANPVSRRGRAAPSRIIAVSCFRWKYLFQLFRAKDLTEHPSCAAAPRRSRVTPTLGRAKDETGPCPPPSSTVVWAPPAERRHAVDTEAAAAAAASAAGAFGGPRELLLRHRRRETVLQHGQYAATRLH